MKTQEKIKSYCTQLRLPHISNCYIQEIEKAVKTKPSYQDFLVRLLEEEVLSKWDTSINNLIKKADFPAIKRLEEFDFSFQPQIDEKRIRELASLRFMNEAKNIVLLGPPGVGKTHLAISIGVKACQQKKQVLFFAAEQLMQRLAEAEVSGTLRKFLQKLIHADLIIFDELGYVELSKKSAHLFFQLISKRYEKASLIITSNKPFDEWGKIFQDEVLASAILDRILHHCHPFFIQGKSFRMKNITGDSKPKQKVNED